MTDWETKGFVKHSVTESGVQIYVMDGRFYVESGDRMRSLRTLEGRELRRLGISSQAHQDYLREEKDKPLTHFQRADQLANNGNGPKAKTEIVKIERDPARPMTMAIVRPMVNAQEALAVWDEFQDIKQNLLTKDDYMEIRGKPFIKKSGFRKFGVVFNLSDEILTKSIEKDENGNVIYAEFTVRVTAPNGRVSEGWASCSASERGHKEDKKDKRGNVTCKGPCDGLSHFAHPNHDIPATAMTRAKNRAISDAVAAGEVSAEEISR